MTINLNDSILDKILTFQEYKGMKHDVPYIIYLQNQSQEILYFGSEHSRNPEDTQFQQVESLFQEFVGRHKKDDIVVVIENFLPSFENAKESMIEKYGETGLLRYLANKHELESICPEPSYEQLARLTVEFYGFPKGKIAHWIFLNTFWNKLGRSTSITHELLKQFLEVCLIIEKTVAVGWISRLDMDIDTYKTISLESQDYRNYLSKITKFYTQPLHDEFQNLFAAKVEDFIKAPIDFQKVKQIQDPFERGTIYNDIGCAINNVRDRYIAGNILELLRNGKSVFTVFGSNHAVTQGPALRAYFDKKNKGSSCENI